MDIRRAEEGDIEAVFGLESACFPDPWSRKTLRETLREERKNVWAVRMEPNRRRRSAKRLFPYIRGLAFDLTIPTWLNLLL